MGLPGSTGIQKIKIEPRTKGDGPRKVEEIRLMNIVPYLGTTNVFNCAQFMIEAVKEPYPGFEITPNTGPGGTIFVPATAILAMKYSK